MPTEILQDIHTVADISALNSLTLNDQDIVFVKDQHSGGIFVYKANLNVLPDQGRIIADTNNRIFIRLEQTALHPTWYGAIGDGVADDTSAIQSWFNHGGRILEGSYKVTDVNLILNLRITSGNGGLFYKNILYPAGNIVNEFIQLPVPSVFPTIHDAVEWLDIKRVVGSGGVDILIADGTYAINHPIQPKWLDGQLISIRGNESQPNRVILNLDNTNNNDCFLFTSGVGISWLNGFQIQGVNGWVSQGVWNTQCYGAGIRAVGGCNVKCGIAIMIDKVYYGIRSMQGSTIHANVSEYDGSQGGGMKVTNAGDVAFHAYNAALECMGAEAYYTGHTSEGLGFGFCAEAGGMIICEYAKAVGNEKAGFYALSNGTTWAHGVDSNNNQYGVLAWGGSVECNSLGKAITTIYQNKSHGIYATKRGFIGANGALANENSGCGFIANTSSFIDMTDTVSTKNTLHGYSAETNATLDGDNARAENNVINGFNAQSGAVLQGQNLSANSNQANGYYARTGGCMFTIGMAGINNGNFSSPQPQIETDTFKIENMGSFISLSP